MRALWCLFAAGAAALLLAFPASAASQASDTPRVLVVEFDNDVNPVTQDYLQDEMHRAVRDGFSAVVIEMDTPGGLGSSMREIVKTMLGLELPVVVYVAPPGSSADSAGAVIGQAADVLAMAPQTNIGSSTPISATGEDLGRDLRKKVINDAAAYIAELAREHGRNAAAAESMVRDAANFGAREALDKNVIDVIAPTVPALLDEIDGTKVVPKGIVLNTAGAQVERVEMGFWKRALDVLIDPNIIALMLSLGLVGILVELWNPGLILPGTVGVISLLVGLYGLQVLPVSAAGILLMLFAAGLFVAEAFVVSHGALTVAGAVSFVFGALILFDPAGPNYQVSIWVALAVALSISAFMFFVAAKLLQARRRPPETGDSLLVGTLGVVDRSGWVLANGERWRASASDERPLRPGDEVRVVGVDGLTLAVEHEPDREPVA